MLAQRYRLPAHLISHFPGTKHSGRYLMVRSLPSTLDYDRLATIISKKVYLKAHDRNALKRALHSALSPLVDAPPHFDLLIIAHPISASVTPAQAAAELAEIITHLKL